MNSKLTWDVVDGCLTTLGKHLGEVEWMYWRWRWWWRTKINRSIVSSRLERSIASLSLPFVGQSAQWQQEHFCSYAAHYWSTKDMPIRFKQSLASHQGSALCPLISLFNTQLKILNHTPPELIVRIQIWCQLIVLLFLTDSNSVDLGIYLHNRCNEPFRNLFIDLMTDVLHCLMVIRVAHRSKATRDWLIRRMFDLSCYHVHEQRRGHRIVSRKELTFWQTSCPIN